MEKKIPDINKRFIDIIQDMGYSGYKLSKEVDEITESKLTHIRAGRNQPSKELISALLKKFPSINYNWLLNGIGDKLKKESDDYIFSLNNEKLPVDKIVDVMLLNLDKFEKNNKFIEYIEKRESIAVSKYQEQLLTDINSKD